MYDKSKHKIQDSEKKRKQRTIYFEKYPKSQKMMILRGSALSPIHTDSIGAEKSSKLDHLIRKKFNSYTKKWSSSELFSALIFACLKPPLAQIEREVPGSIPTGSKSGKLQF